MAQVRRRAKAAAMVAALVVLAGCGEDNKVGEGLEVKAPSGDTAGCRLGECTTTSTTQASPTAAAPPTTARRATAPTSSSPTTSTVKAREVVFVIKIQGDDTGTHFKPSVANVEKGTTVRWTNTDTVARTVEAENGAFASPSIAPGASFDYKTSTPGRVAYHDGTRPYAIAYLEVA